MAEKKASLDLDRLPTLEEMQDFFKENDWSAAKIFTEPELADAISHGKELLAPVMEKAMQEHGLGVWSGYFDNKVRSQKLHFGSLSGISNFQSASRRRTTRQIPVKV